MKDKALCILAGWGLRRCGTLPVIGINKRNLDYIYPSNSRRDFLLADDKILTKEVLTRAGVPLPETYRIYGHFFELLHLEKDLGPYQDFVIKPSQGSGGGGVIIITGRGETYWKGIGGATYTTAGLKKHISDIIFGVYSFDLTDRALVEARVIQHDDMSVLSPFGLADVRVIHYRDEPALAMTRLPTKASNGRANLHQGAVGVGIDLETGRTIHAVLGGEGVDRHPDTGVSVIDMPIPYWDEVLSVSRRAASAVPLKYLGVDIAISRTGPVLIEINVRPGLEIQNANMRGLRPQLERLG
jgi:alpha-L-glutamate ligase-like protein